MIGNIPWYDALQLLIAAGVLAYVVVHLARHRSHGVRGPKAHREARR
jgi:hypothetical protein